MKIGSVVRTFHVPAKAPAFVARPQRRLGQPALDLQRKPLIGPIDDPLEREADRVAEAIVSGAAAPPITGAVPPAVQPACPACVAEDDTVRRMCAACEAEEQETVLRQTDKDEVDETVRRQVDEEEEEEELQLKAEDGGPRSAGAAAAAAAVAHGGRPLSPTERAYFEPRFGRDLSTVRIHNDAPAGAAAQGIGARAFTLGAHIAFGPGAYSTRSSGGRRLIAHELAHTLQQRGVHTTIQRRTLTDLDARIRRALRFSRIAPERADIETWMKSYFDPQSGSSRQPGAPIEWDPAIADANLKKGLTSIAAELIWASLVQVTPATAGEPEIRTNTDPEKWPLPENSILDIELDARKFGHDHAIYRFIRFTEGGTDRVLIEKRAVFNVAAAPAVSSQGGTPASRPAPQAAPQTRVTTATQSPGRAAAPSFTGTVSAGAIKVTIDTAFGDQRGKIIADAVALVPAPIRAKADGVSFEYAGSGKGPGEQNGQYDPATDTVKLWGDLFAPSLRRTGVASNQAYQIVHEVGHVLDLRPQFAAQRARDKVEAQKKKLKNELRTVWTRFMLEDTSGDPLAGLVDDPKVKAEEERLKKEIDKAEKEIDSLNAAMARAKSISGHELGADAEDLTTEFGKALTADGVTAVPDAIKKNREAMEKHRKAVQAAEASAEKASTEPVLAASPMMLKTLRGGVSSYAETDLMEAFAENFAYYVLDEDTLEAIRPSTHAFFRRRFPKTAPSAQGAGRSR